VFQTDSQRFSQAKAAMREQLHRMKHHPVKEQVRAINQILRGHFNYYGIAGNARKIQAGAKIRRRGLLTRKDSGRFRVFRYPHWTTLYEQDGPEFPSLFLASPL